MDICSDRAGEMIAQSKAVKKFYSTDTQGLRMTTYLIIQQGAQMKVNKRRVPG